MSPESTKKLAESMLLFDGRAQEPLRHKSLSTTERYVRGLPTIKPYLKVFEGGRSREASSDKFTSDLRPEGTRDQKEARPSSPTS